MRSSRPLVLVVTVVVAALTATSSAQHQLQPVAALRGTPAVELALRKLDTVGTFMMTTAHPDDENNAMLAYYGHGKGMRTTLVTATRGEGGQNEIGPELFEALAVLRTEELLARAESSSRDLEAALARLRVSQARLQVLRSALESSQDKVRWLRAFLPL